METMSLPVKLMVFGNPCSLRTSKAGLYNFLPYAELGPMAPPVVVATSDLYLQSEINQVAKSRGFETRFSTGEKEMLTLVKATSPKLVVLDLSSDEYDPFSCARSLKALGPSPRILGFFPHVKTELAMRAKTAGVDYVVPNSGFLKSLRDILGELAAR